MLFAFTIVFREAVEVGLVIAIMLAYLRKLGKPELVRHVYYGTIVGAVASVGLAAGLFTLYTPTTAIAVGAPASAAAFFAALLVLGYMMRRYMNMGIAPGLMIGIALGFMFAGLYGYASTKAAEALEAGALFSATILLTYMIYWMATVAYRLKERITTRIDLSVTTGKLLGVLALTSAAVLREGAEAALLLTAVMLVSPTDTVMGAALGLLGASLISYVYIAKAVKLNWRKFFLYTSLLLIIFSSGILKVGLEDVVTIGLFPPLVHPVYDARVILPEEGVVGGLLYVLLGYTGEPPLMPLLGQAAYLLFALTMIARVYQIRVPILSPPATVGGRSAPPKTQIRKPSGDVHSPLCPRIFRPPS